MIYLQINPLAETATGTMMAADAKLNFDDNAAFRQKEIFAMRDTTQEDPREVCCKFPRKLLQLYNSSRQFIDHCAESNLSWHITVFAVQQHITSDFRRPT